MLVSDLMTRDVATIVASETLHDAVDRMARRRVRHLPVVDGAGHLVGVLTDRDIRHYLFAPRVLPEIGRVPVETLLKGACVRDVMSCPVISVPPTEPLETAGRLMLEGKLGSLPVVDGGRVVGIITETDLLRRIVREDACCQPVDEIIISFP